MSQYDGVIISLLVIIIIVIIIIVILQIIFVYLPLREIGRDANTIVSATTELIPKVDGVIEGAMTTEEKIDGLVSEVEKLEPLAQTTFNNVNTAIANTEGALCSSFLSSVCTNGRIDPSKFPNQSNLTTSTMSGATMSTTRFTSTLGAPMPQQHYQNYVRSRR